MSRFPLRAALLVLLAVFSAPQVSASLPFAGFTLPHAQERVAGNTSVAVTWTLSGGLDADEMELVLSLDGGATFPVRVTKEFAPGADRMLWRVPNLPTSHARLALRADVEDHETVLFVSPPFEILPDPVQRLEEVVEVCGELHTRDAVESRRDSSLPGGGLHSTGERISALLFEADVDDSGSFLVSVPPPATGPLTGEAPSLLTLHSAPRTGARISLPKRE